MSLESFGDEGTFYSDDNDPEKNPLWGVHKPRKRDRDAIRYAMNGAINERCQKTRYFDIESHTNSGDHSLRFRAINDAHFEINRFRWEWPKSKVRRLRNFSTYYEHLARMHRYVTAAKGYRKPNLP